MRTTGVVVITAGVALMCAAGHSRRASADTTKDASNSGANTCVGASPFNWSVPHQGAPGIPGGLSNAVFYNDGSAGVGFMSLDWANIGADDCIVRLTADKPLHTYNVTIPCGAPGGAGGPITFGRFTFQCDGATGLVEDIDGNDWVGSLDMDWDGTDGVLLLRVVQLENLTGENTLCGRRLWLTLGAGSPRKGFCLTDADCQNTTGTPSSFVHCHPYYPTNPYIGGACLL